MDAIGGPSPATFTFDALERIANWRPLVAYTIAGCGIANRQCTRRYPRRAYMASCA
jgi:hypothetical protein